jgi:putative intracellular protease/amidase
VARDFVTAGFGVAWRLAGRDQDPGRICVIGSLFSARERHRFNRRSKGRRDRLLQDSVSKRKVKMTIKGKVLVLVSGGHGLPLKDDKVYAGAGYYLNELTVPVRALMKEGYEITFANPNGNTPQMDIHSAVADFFAGDEARLQDYLKFRDALTGLKNPTRIADVIASGLDQYDAVFVPGGHGPMMDLLDDPDAGTVLRHFHKTSKPTAVLCHGPISLLSALPNSTEVVGALATGDTA